MFLYEICLPLSLELLLLPKNLVLISLLRSIHPSPKLVLRLLVVS